jgi:transketolase
LIPALERARGEVDRPQCIVARTLKGKGVSFMERDYGYHGKPLTPEERLRALEELGWN